MKRVFEKPYRYWVVGIFVLYLLLNVLFSGFYSTLQLIFKYAATVDWLSLSVSVIFALAIGFLIAVNSVLLFLKYRERQQCRSAATMTSVGTIGGFVTGVCPLCVTGLFPLLFSVFGISFSLGGLPFKGLEVQALTLLLLGVSLFVLSRKKSYGTTA